MGADQMVDLAANDRAERAAGHHDAKALGTMALGERLRHQGNPDHDFGACAEAREEAEDAELQRALGEALASGEDTEHQDAECERPHPADIVGDDAEQESAECPAQQPDHAEITANLADLGDRRLSPEQIRQRGAKDDREEAEVGCIEGPADPRGDKHSPLIAVNFAKPAETARPHIAGIHQILPWIAFRAYLLNNKAPAGAQRAAARTRGTRRSPNRLQRRARRLDLLEARQHPLAETPDALLL